MEKEIRLVARTGKSKDGKPFTSFSAVQKDGKLVRCHFKKKDEKGKPIVMPVGSCIMKIDTEFLQLNKSGLYPQLWILAQPEYLDLKVKNNTILDETF